MLIIKNHQTWSCLKMYNLDVARLLTVTISSHTWSTLRLHSWLKCSARKSVPICCTWWSNKFYWGFLEKVWIKDDIAYHVANVTAIPFKHLYSTRISSLNISLLSRLLLLFPFLCLGSLSQHKFLSMVWNNSVLALNLSIPLKKRKAQ